MSFKKDLAFGNIAEKFIQDKIASGYGIDSQSKTDKGSDMDITFSIEVKTDRLTRTTGNVAIESECSGKPSGITSSTSAVWIWKIEDTYFYAWKKDILNYIEEFKPRVVMGGDGNRAKLNIIPFFDFINYLAHKL